MSAFAVGGLVAHSAFLFYQQANSLQDFFYVIAWGLVVLYLYLSYAYPKTQFGLAILPLVLALITFSAFWADTTPFGTENMLWRRVHGISFMFMSISVFSGGIFGGLYLFQERQLKKKFSLGTQASCLHSNLPSLEMLASAARRFALLSFLFLCVGIFSGFMMPRNFISQPDPLLVGCIGLLSFLFILVFEPRGRVVALLSIIAVAYLLSILFMQSHWQGGGL